MVVRFYEESGETQKEHLGLVENCSAGGMYITTEYPLPRGKIVIVKFQSHSPKIPHLFPFEVRAIVRWARLLNEPKGMGVEFLKFPGIGESEFREWIVALGV